MIKKLFLFIGILLVSNPVFAGVFQFSPSTTIITSSNPTTNYSSSANPHISGSDAYLISTSLASIPAGQTVVHAYFYFYSGRDYAQTLNFYRLLTNINYTQATWNISSTGNNWNTAGALGLNTDYTTTNTATTGVNEGAYLVADITSLTNDALAAGSGALNIALRSATNGAGTYINSSVGPNPPYVVIVTTPTGAFNTWYVRDGGSNFGTTSGTCNGLTNTVFTGSNGPNCALNSVAWIMGTQGGALPLWNGGDTLNIDGDSDSSWWFPVTAVSTPPAAGDIYSTGGNNYTVIQSINTAVSSGSFLMSGTVAPASSGTLTRVSGSGTTPLTYVGESVGQAQYQIGWFMPGMTPAVVNNPTGCYSTNKGGCTLNDTLMGPSSTHPTRILGTGSQRAQLWGTYGITFIISLIGNADMENLELTSHTPCGGQSGGINDIVDGFGANCTSGSFQSVLYAQQGLQLQGEYITTKNNYIHRFADGNVLFAANLEDWTSIGDIVTGSGGAGALTQETNGGSGNNESFGPDFNTLNGDIWAFGGCSEHYPDPDPGNPLDYKNYHHCCDQTCRGGNYPYGLGGGFMQQSNAAPCGSWNFINSKFMYNLKTNIDFLHCSSIGTINFIRSRSEGSSGEAFKMGGGTESGQSGNPPMVIHIEESQMIANAYDWYQPKLLSIVSTTDGGGNNIQGQYNLEMCRGGGSEIFTTSPGAQWTFVNSEVTGNCTALIDLNAGDNSCTGVNLKAYNSKFIGGEFQDLNGDRGRLVDLMYNSGDDGDGDGNCGSGVIPFVLSNTACYNTDTPSLCSAGTNMVLTDPLVVGETNFGAFTNWLGPTAYYSGIDLGDQLYLQNTSPLIGAASASAPITNGSFYDYNIHAPNSPLDIGALQINTCVKGITNNLCSIGSGQCCNAQTCSSNSDNPPGSCPAASTGCGNNGASSPVGALCCSGVSFANTCVASAPSVPTTMSFKGGEKGNIGR